MKDSPEDYRIVFLLGASSCRRLSTIDKLRQSEIYNILLSAVITQAVIGGLLKSGDRQYSRYCFHYSENYRLEMRALFDGVPISTVVYLT